VAWCGDALGVFLQTADQDLKLPNGRIFVSLRSSLTAMVEAVAAALTPARVLVKAASLYRRILQDRSITIKAHLCPSCQDSDFSFEANASSKIAQLVS
jgi:hypothetical protein